MKQFFKIFFAALLAVMVAGVILVGIFSGMIMSAASSLGEKPQSETKENSILVVDLSKNISENGMKNSFALFTDASSYQAGLYDIIEGFKAAAKDKNIKGLYIKMNSSPLSWATAQQVRNAILEFKKAGKFVYAYGESVAQNAYYIASAADSVFVNPSGDLEFFGLASSIPFFKGTLDKLEIQPEIFYAGKFKSATEPFRLDKASEPNKEQIKAYQDDLWESFVAAAAEHSKNEPATIEQLVQQGAIQFPAQAVPHRIIDGLKYEDEVIALMKQKLGKKEDDKIAIKDINDYSYDTKTARSVKSDRIGLLLAEGEIVSGKGNGEAIASEDMVKTIRDMKNNDKIKAVVLRVNSPGGSALASDVILRELELLQKKKPLVVSMGDLAASGGYYISCKAHKIYAMPNTLTGSIGVFGMLFNTAQLMKNKLGITIDVVKNAPYADFPSTTRALSADEGARMQAYIDTIYNTFKGHVATGRKLDPVLVDSFAQGRVWTGKDALDLGLVDALGGLDEAIKSAAELAKLKEYSISVFPEAQDKLEQLLQRYGGKADAAFAGAYIEQQLGKEYQYYLQINKFLKWNKQPMAIWMGYPIK